MKFFLSLITLLLILTGCQSGGGGSSVDEGFSVGLKAPGKFSFKVAQGGDTRVRLNWGSSDRSSSYSLFVGSSPTTITTPISGCASTTNCVVTGLTDGTTYYFSVTANNSAGKTKITAPARVLPVSPFEIQTATPSNKQVTLTWDPSSFATIYEVRYGLSSGQYTRVATTSTSSPYTVTGLSNGLTYYFRVYAKNANGGFLASTSEITGDPFGPPDAPTNLVPTVSGDNIQLNWDSVLGATSYNVYRGTSPGVLSLLSSGLATNSFVDSTPTAGTRYYYKVSADNGQESALSTEVSGQTIAAFSVTGISPGGAANQLIVTWNAAAGATAYDLVGGTSPGASNLRFANVTSPATATSLVAGTTYYFRVEAKNTIGPGTTRVSTNELSGIPLASLDPPNTPSLSATPGQVSVSWGAVVGATHYQVLRGLSAGSLSLLADNIVATSYLDSTAANGTTYFYAIRASNGILSPASTASSIRPIGTFSISSSTSTSATSVTLAWGAAVGAQAYDIVYGTSSGNLSTTITGATSPRTITGLTQGTLYFFAVRARNALTSAVVVQTAEDSQRTLPASPTNLAVTGSPGQVSLTWDVVSGASNYQIYRGTVSGTYSLIQANEATNSYVDTTVANGTTYFYVVRATNVAQSTNSNEEIIRTIAVPPAPTLTVVSATSVRVTWAAVSGAAAYDVLYGTTSGSLSSTATGVASNVVISGLTSNTDYYFALRARNAIGPGVTEESTESSIRTPTAAPTGLVATASPGQVSLTWNAAAGAGSYKVLRGTVSGSYTEISTGLMVTNFTDNSVANGTTYFYVVRSFNGSDSVNSSEVSVRPIASFAISSTAVNSSSSITLTWSAAAGAATYDILYGTSPGVYSTTITGATSPRIINSLSENTTYYFIIRGKNTIGLGTEIDTAETSALTAYGAPTGVNVTGELAATNVSWNAVAGASSYRVLRGTASGGPYTAIATGVVGTTYRDSAITAGTTYYYVVQSFNGSFSANSTQDFARPLGNFAATLTVLSSSELRVTWPASTGATSYDLSYGTSSGVYDTTLTGVTSPRVLSGLSAGVTYYVKVTAKNTIGGGAVGDTAEESAATSFGAPTTISATGTPTAVNVSWAPVVGSTSYKLFRGTSSGSYSLLASGIVPASYSDTTAVTGQQYFYVVRAFNGTDSPDSVEATVKSIDAVPALTIDAVTSSSFTVSWAAVAGADEYDLLYGTSAGSLNLSVNSTTSPTTVSGLNANTTYHFALRAKNNIGDGTTSQSTTQNQRTATAVPALSLNFTPGSANLSWAAVTGAASYRVYRGTSPSPLTQIASGITGTSYADTTAVNGTTYYYTVRTFNGTESADSNQRFGKPIESFSITSLTTTSSSGLIVDFPTTDGADTYDVAWGTVAGTYPNVAAGVTSPHTITGLASGTTYFVVVRGRNTIGVTTMLQTTVVSRRTALVAPTTLTATSTPTQVNLSWSAVAGNTGYNVLRGTTSGVLSVIASTGTNVTTYADTTISAGTTYFYAIQTLNGSAGPTSVERSTKPIASFATTSVAATSSSTIDVTFPGSAGADTFDVAWGTVSGSYPNSATNVTSPFTITSLSTNTTYYIVVRGRNAVGAGTLFQTTVQSALTATGAPTGLALVASSGSVSASWAAVSGATSYNLYRGTTSGALSQIATGIVTNTRVDATVTNGITYFYAVSANNGTESVQSAEKSVQPIAAFTQTTLAYLNTTSLQLTWPTTSGATAYRVSVGTSSGTYTSNFSNVTSPYTITGLLPGTTYFTRVTASNTIGDGTTLASTNELSQATNSLPVISVIASQTMESDTSQLVAFTATDPNNALNCSTSVSVTSSNTALIDTGDITRAGTAPNCTLNLVPKVLQTGTSTITVTLTDGFDTVQRTFALTVTPCTVASIAWDQQPVGMAAGNTFATVPIALLRRADLSTCATNPTPVTLSVNDDFSIQGDAEITEGEEVVPVAGIATFSAAKMTRSGTNFTVIASSGAIQSPESSAFTVSAAATVAGIAFFTQPSLTDRFATMIPSPTVRPVDIYGNPRTTPTAIPVTLSLQNNAVGAVMSGTLVRNINSGASSVTFSGLSINQESTFFMRASTTTVGVANSNNFDIAAVFPQTHVSTIEMLQGPLVHATGSVSYNRTANSFSSSSIDGTTSWSFEVVATNTSGSPTTVRLRRGGTNIAAVTVPAGTSVPTFFSSSFAAGLISTTNSTYTVRVEGSTTSLFTARVIAKQTNANRAQVYIPLTSIPYNFPTPYITTASTTAVNPNDTVFGSFVWDTAKLRKVDSAILYFSFTAGGGGANACLRLVNKSTGVIIGSERCSTSTSENVTSQTITPSSIANGTIIEVRLRTTNASFPARLYKAGLIARLVSIQNSQNIQIIAAARSGLTTTTTDFLENRFKDYSDDFSTGALTSYQSCQAKATANGSSLFRLFDHGLNFSGNVGASAVALGDSTFTNQTLLTERNSPGLTMDQGDTHFVRYSASSGVYNLSRCFMIHEVSY